MTPSDLLVPTLFTAAAVVTKATIAIRKNGVREVVEEVWDTSVSVVADLLSIVGTFLLWVVLCGLYFLLR